MHLTYTRTGLPSRVQRVKPVGPLSCSGSLIAELGASRLKQAVGAPHLKPVIGGTQHMRYRPCTVIVTQLPEKLDGKQGRMVFRELESSMNADRPCVVLDCSKVLQMDSRAIRMLLCCLEEAMKRNGDVKLAALTSSAREILELTGVDRLFEMYETDTDAVNSFFRPHFEQVMCAHVPQADGEIAESAA